jgi:hypothetical protein
VSSKEARLLYARLCEGKPSVVPAHPSVDAFYDELATRHPEVDELSEDQLDDKDLCPWSVSMDRSDGHVAMSCVWSRAAGVEATIKDLAAKHGLVAYDPQQGLFPDTSGGGPLP